MQGNKNTLHGPLRLEGQKKLECAEKPIYITFTEKSVMQRKSLIRGSATLNQLETMYMMTNHDTAMAEKLKTHHEARTWGMSLGQSTCSTRTACGACP